MEDQSDLGSGHGNETVAEKSDLSEVWRALTLYRCTLWIAARKRDAPQRVLVPGFWNRHRYPGNQLYRYENPVQPSAAYYFTSLTFQEGAPSASTSDRYTAVDLSPEEKRPLTSALSAALKPIHGVQEDEWTSGLKTRRDWMPEERPNGRNENVPDDDLDSLGDLAELLKHIFCYAALSKRPAEDDWHAFLWARTVFKWETAGDLVYEQVSKRVQKTRRSRSEPRTSITRSETVFSDAGVHYGVFSSPKSAGLAEFKSGPCSGPAKALQAVVDQYLESDLERCYQGWIPLKPNPSSNNFSGAGGEFGGGFEFKDRKSVGTHVGDLGLLRPPDCDF